MYYAAIFDWDGTLADTKDIVVTSFQIVLNQIGCHVTDEFIERLIGIGSRNTFKEALKAKNIPFDEKAISKLVERKIDTNIGLADSVKLFDGAPELLESLKGEVKIALASMNDRKIIEKMLEVTRIKRCLQLIISAEEIDRPKPDPEIFLKCASEFAIEPERCVVLEDSVFGVEAAKAAKMKCIAVSTGAYCKRELDDAGADMIVGSLTEKDRILRFIWSTEKR
jgi:beta-phosphoglucomutase-like phosphatase (HAD superfamily)